jgi:hypothetical protein
VSGAAEVDGLKTMASWLRGHGHLSVAEAARVVRAGRALAHLPGLAAAFAAGAVTGEQAAGSAAWPIPRRSLRLRSRAWSWRWWTPC